MRRLLALAGALLIGASPSLAMTTKEREQHAELVDALIDNNITLIINEPSHCSNEDRYYGAFIPAERTIVICQQNKTVFDGQIIPFTPEDLDTLRHEAHHLVQDCSNGRIDGYMVPLFDDSMLNTFLARMSAERVQNIRNIYARGGASPHVVKIELEAFAVASQVDAATIANGVNTICENK